ncbi:ABC transporter ATP-binding protein [Parafrankia sp. FMc2]|uniref:ABC transporter ATP-binding protein n=1 Tax=Parafrankia sp. FMc2 TaxID=3233196 RepID=UPI0034D5583E
MTTAITGAPRRVNALEVRGLVAGYGRTTVLREVNLTVPAGSVVALLGPNGAGKTTLLRTVSGLLRPSGGTVLVDGEDVTTRTPHARARAGVCLVPEGRGVFPNLTVRENLALAVPRWRKGTDVEPALAAFPVLRERIRQIAGTMSGGQQQMLALARCYLAGPSVILLDEVSMGLAPKVVDEIFEALAGLARSGASLLVVEQYVNRALAMADFACLLNRGSVTYTGPADLLDEAELTRRYLGADLDAEHGTAAGDTEPVPLRP